MRRLIVASLAAISFSALAVAQEPVTIRRDDGRWGTANRAWALEDVPPSSPLYGIRVTDSSDGRSVLVDAVPEDSRLLRGIDLMRSSYQGSWIANDRRTPAIGRIKFGAPPTSTAWRRSVSPAVWFAFAARKAPRTVAVRR